MKIPKLLFLGTLLVALYMAVPVTASDITATKKTSRDLEEPPGLNIYYVGETIHYVMTVSNPGTNTATNTLTDIWDTLPDGSIHWFIQDGVDLPLVQAPGATATFYLDYVVDAADIIAIPAGLGVRNQFDAEGFDSQFDNLDAHTERNSRVIQPNTAVGISADPAGPVCVGDEVDLIVTEENTGDDPLTSVQVQVWNPVGPVLIATLDATTATESGTDNDILDVGETWTWTISGVVISGTTQFDAFGSGSDSLGNPVAFPTYPTEKASTEVRTIDPPVCLIQGPDEVCEGSPPVQYCASVDDADSYLWEITGDGAIVGDNDGDCVMVSPTGPGGFTLSLTICYATCCSTCDLPVDVIPTPDCDILGPEALCDSDIGNPITYCSDGTADHYVWEVISGPATIDGPDNEMCVDIIPTGLGTIVLELQIWNGVPGDGACGNSCRIEIVVEECGGAFCTFTQGFWGNPGGKACDGTKTIDLIAACVPLTVGTGARTITLGTAQCVIDLLPAGGTPAVLPVGNFSCPAPVAIPGSLKNKQGRFNNVLIG